MGGNDQLDTQAIRSRQSDHGPRAGTGSGLDVRRRRTRCDRQCRAIVHAGPLPRCAQPRTRDRQRAMPLDAAFTVLHSLAERDGDRLTRTAARVSSRHPATD